MIVKSQKPIEFINECGKIDVYLNDNHECNAGLEMARQEAQDHDFN